jgi:prevent-host-death family protein
MLLRRMEMKFATVRVLKNQTSEMLRTAAGGTDVLITSHGKPVAVLHGIDEGGLEDFIYARHHGLRKSIEDADREHRKQGGITLAEMERRLKERRGQGRGKARR